MMTNSHWRLIIEPSLPSGAMRLGQFAFTFIFTTMHRNIYYLFYKLRYQNNYHS